MGIKIITKEPTTEPLPLQFRIVRKFICFPKTLKNIRVSWSYIYILERLSEHEMGCLDDGFKREWIEQKFILPESIETFNKLVKNYNSDLRMKISTDKQIKKEMNRILNL